MAPTDWVFSFDSCDACLVEVPEEEQYMEEVRIDRRKFLGAAAGVAGAAALGTWSPWAESRPNGPNGPIVTRETLGIQHFSVRDAFDRPPSTASNAVLGYLGGKNFPEDPTDVGPLVKLPGGYAEVFEFLAQPYAWPGQDVDSTHPEIGIGGFEFFQYTQFANYLPANDPGRTPSLQQLRKWLDDAGMKSIGTHTGGTGLTSPQQGRANIEIAHVLGHRMIGTAGDATGNSNYSNTREAWLGAAETFNAMGEWLKKEGIKLFFHPEGTWWTFLADPDHPELNQTNKIDFFAANTDPRVVNFEIDTYHMYANRAARPYSDGSLWDAEAFVKRNWKRLVGYHVKDANRILPNTPAPPSVPFTQTWTRTNADGSKTFPLVSGVDGIYSMEGHLGNRAASRAKPGFTPRGAGFDPGSTPRAPAPARTRT